MDDGLNGEDKTEPINEPIQLHNIMTYKDHSDILIKEKDYNETKSTTASTSLFKDEMCYKQPTIRKQEDMCYTQQKINELNNVHEHVHTCTAHSEDCITHSMTNEHNSCKSGNKKVLKPIDPNKVYTNEETAMLAHEMKGVTILLTNKGKVYKNSKRRHAEIVFIQDTSNPKEISQLFIKNSPCSDCAKHLITYFKNCDIKPDIFIGKIYQPHKKVHVEGLKDLMKEGFNLQVWESFQQNPPNKSPNPEEYLLRLKSETKVIQ